MKNNALFQGIVAVFIFGTLPASIRFVNAEPFTLGIFRLVMGAALIFPFLGKIKFRNYQKDWKMFLIIGICFGLHWLTYFYSIKISSASIGAIGVCTFGVHLLILGYFFSGTRFSKVDFLAVIMAILGCVQLVPNFSFNDNYSIGLILSVFSGFLYAVLPILHKKISHVPTMLRTYFQFLFALVVFLPFFYKTNWDLKFSAWLGMIYLGTVCTVLAHALWVKATTELSPVTSSIIYYAYLPISLILNNIILSESFSMRSLIGVLLIASANLIAFIFGSAFLSSTQQKLDK